MNIALNHAPGAGLNGDLGHDSALQGYTGPGTTWNSEMNFYEPCPSAGVNDVLGHKSALWGYTVPDNLGKWDEFVQNHASGLIAHSVDLQSSVLPLYHCTAIPLPWFHDDTSNTLPGIAYDSFLLPHAFHSCCWHRTLVFVCCYHTSQAKASHFFVQ